MGANCEALHRRYSELCQQFAEFAVQRRPYDTALSHIELWLLQDLDKIEAQLSELDA